MLQMATEESEGSWAVLHPGHAETLGSCPPRALTVRQEVTLDHVVLVLVYAVEENRKTKREKLGGVCVHVWVCGGEGEAMIGRTRDPGWHSGS